MSPVFSAVFLWLMATILWWSGWREEAGEGFPHWMVGSFLAIWPLALLANVAITPSLQVNGAWLWTLFALITMAWRTNPNRRWTSISAGVLLGSIYLLLCRLAYYPSGFSHFIAPWGTAILVGCLSALLLRNSTEQLLAISTALYLSEGITVFVQSTSDTFPIVKASEWLEVWWISVLVSRLWSISVKSAAIQARRWAFKMGWKRGRHSS
ncbi:hypothetical protein [Cohnella silvisoli]|uniref:DUF5668 domain-containing protein n=1 Tax=Cohnella silvisoli TaxID=2873699 RepID=A0ABV1KN07_9BACL|nr:hypothetical protein [Cohnella silvisoli]MCD9021226.1 hypothetical protein [Cohnella silvisoli]